MDKRYYALLSLVTITSLYSCNAPKDNTSNTLTKEENITTRTISKDETILHLDKGNYVDLGKYEYTSQYETEDEDPLYTLEEVNKIAEELNNQYNAYLEDSINSLSKEYETYISSLNDEYNSLQNEYNSVLNDLYNSIYDEENENKEDIIPPEDTKDEAKEDEIKDKDESSLDNPILNEDEVVKDEPLSREDEINAIYDEVLKEAGDIKEEFFPLQGSN